MPVPSPRPPQASRPHDVRRLRDLLRAALAGRRFPGMRLPGESELMVGFGTSRTTVRAALALLRDEGLIEPPGSSGTHGVAPRRQVGAVPEPVVPAAREILLDDPAGPGAAARGGVHSCLLDRSGVPAPASLAAWLGVSPGAPCLRMEFVTTVHGVPSAVATHYVLQPEAAELLGFPMRADWPTLLDDAGLARRGTEVELGHIPADPAVAELLAVATGTLLVAAEETTWDATGRVFDAAVLRMVGGAAGVPGTVGDGAGAGHRVAG